MYRHTTTHAFQQANLVLIYYLYIYVHSSFFFFFSVTQPLFLGGLVNYYATPGNKSNANTAYLYALGVILCSALNVIFYHPYMLATLHTGMKVRVALCSVIYRKALRLSKTALGDTTTGQVVNLISNDVGRLDTSLIQMHYLWLAPVEIVIITLLMYREVSLMKR